MIFLRQTKVKLYTVHIVDSGSTLFVQCTHDSSDLSVHCEHNVRWVLYYKHSQENVNIFGLNYTYAKERINTIIEHQLKVACHPNRRQFDLDVAYDTFDDE